MSGHTLSLSTAELERAREMLRTGDWPSVRIASDATGTYAISRDVDAVRSFGLSLFGAEALAERSDEPAA